MATPQGVFSTHLEHGLKDATTDAEQIRRWWQRWPQANVAIVTGAPSGLLVVDIDPRNGGDGQWKKLVAEHGVIEALTVVTGGGGLHLYLRRPDGDLRKQLAAGIDLQGDGRYVVAPPSLHFSGERYQFIDPNLPVADCPPWLGTLAQRSRPRASSAGTIVDLSQVRATAYVKVALQREMQAVAAASEGGRNEQLNRSAFALGQLLDYTDESTVQEALLEAALQAGLPEVEARRTITSGLNAGRQQPRQLSGLVDAAFARSRERILSKGGLHKVGAVEVGGESAHQASEEPRSSAPEAEDESRALPGIVLTTREHEVIDAAIGALAQHPAVYRRSGALVHIVADDRPEQDKVGLLRAPASARIVEMPPARVRELLAATARFLTLDRKEQLREVHPPNWLVAGIMARGEWPGVRRLEAVAEMPILRPSGSVLDTLGYDAETGLFLRPSLKPMPIPERPDRNDAVRAAQELLEVVVDFAFASDAHRAAYLAALLTPLARHAFAGPAPLHLIDANVRGAGKSLLADVIGVILLGRPMARMAPTEDDAELRKRITAVARAGDLLVLIDNVAGVLGGASLDAALTATEWQDRVLGTSDTWQGPLWATWYATGNNVVLTGDLSRRCLHIRLESPEEQPERRQDFRHPELLKWVRQERARLLSAALTLLRAYWVAGRPEIKLPGWGGFEGWSRLIRAAVVWAGQPDPGQTRRQLQTEADPEVASLGDLLAGWQELLESNPTLGKGCTVRQALRLLESDGTGQQYEQLRSGLAELVPSAPGQLPASQRVGQLLRRFRGRVVGGRVLVSLLSTDKHGLRWSVQRATPGRGDWGDWGDVSDPAAIDVGRGIELGARGNIPPIPPIPPGAGSEPVHRALPSEGLSEPGRERNLNNSHHLLPTGDPGTGMDEWKEEA